MKVINGTRIVTIASVLIALSLVLLVVSLDSVSRSPVGRGSPALKPSEVVIPNGSVFNIPPQASVVFPVHNVSAGEILTGMFSVRFSSCSSCQFPLAVVLVLNQTNYLHWTGGSGLITPVGPAGSAVYVTNGTLFSILDTGTVYLVLFNNVGSAISNPPENWTDRFAITSPFVVFPTNSSPPVPPTGLAPFEFLPSLQFTLGGSSFGGGPTFHADFSLPSSYWSWRINGSFTSTLQPVQVQIDESFFGYQPAIYSTNFTVGGSFSVTLPPGTYVLTFVIEGWNYSNCISGYNCPVTDVSGSGLNALPMGSIGPTIQSVPSWSR
jgi:hypothetical protein